MNEILGKDPEYNAKQFLHILDSPNNSFQKIVEINAGAALYVGGKASNINEGSIIAAKTINEGKTKEFISKIISE